MLQIRPTHRDDLNSMTSALATWVRDAGLCGYCHPGDLEHRIYHESDSERPAFLWHDEQGIAGIEIAERFGRVFDVFARPDLRGTDADVEMLRAAATRGDETDAFASDATRISVLHAIGFEQYRDWDHIRMRDLGELPERTLPDGCSISEEATAARATIWFDEVNLVGLFEPVETEESLRRRGFARAVMTEGMHCMRAAGMRTAIVEHDITNHPAAALYESLGFTVAYETLGFRQTTRRST